MFNIITGLKAEAMMNRVEATRTEIIKGEDPWWGETTTTRIYVTIDGIEYRKTIDRDGWTELWRE